MSVPSIAVRPARFAKSLRYAAAKSLGTLLYDPSMNPARIVLYTREGCHLCEHAAAILRQLGVTPHAVDVDEESELGARYTDVVPVVVVDGRVVLSGVISEGEVRRALAAYFH